MKRTSKLGDRAKTAVARSRRESSKDPVRLFDMEGRGAWQAEALGEEPLLSAMQVSTLQNDLRIASQVKVPYDTEAGLARFAALASAGAGGVAASHMAASQVVSQGSAAAKVGAFLKGLTLLKGALVLVGAVGVVGGAVAIVGSVGRSEEVGTTSMATATSMTTSTSMTTATATALTTSMTTPMTTTSTPMTTSMTTANSMTTPTATPMTSAGATAAPVQLKSTDAAGGGADASKATLLKAELEQLVAVRSAASPADALRLAEEGQSHYPHGVFGQEREVLAIRALVKLGRRGEASTRARAFVERHPESPYSEELRALAE